MDDEVSAPTVRGTANTNVWQADCKDCQAERRAMARTAKSRRARGRELPAGDQSSIFEYSDSWAHRTLERGSSRSDRCARHRIAHRSAIRALPVAYIDLQTIGEVPDRKRPTGPLGGLGPLPTEHRPQTSSVDLNNFAMGLSDDNILEIIQGLTDKRVAVIEAGTGTGKSTLLPFRLMNPPPGAATQLSEHGQIVVTEPRKAAAIGLAAFVGEEMCFGHDSKTCTDHIGPGFPVGYQVSGDRKWDTACQLLYVTDGTMINWVRDGWLARIGTVIIDEAHERSENIDIILAQLRDQVKRHEHLRVIVTSATMDKDFFVEYFGGPDDVHYQYIEAKKSFGYGVPFFIGTEITDAVIKQGLEIEVGGTESRKGLGRCEGWTKWGPARDGKQGESLHETTRQLRKLRRQETIPMEEWKDLMPGAVAKQVLELVAGTKSGDILSFLPTTDAINKAVAAIKEGLKERGFKADVYPLLSTTHADIRDKAIEGRSPGEKRKIVVSSNLAETSLTIKGVRYVIDSGLICQSEWDPVIASGSFPTKPHSRSGVRQRWGRVGRDEPGWVFPLYSVEQFQSLPQNTPPGSTQTNLETFYMKLLAAGLDPDEAALPGNFVHVNVAYDENAVQNIETFNQESVRARKALSESGATDNDGHLTDFGRELERFSGSGAEAMAIMLADQLACVHEVALALTVLVGNRLVGDEKALLRSGRQWPTAWRVHAARCHRALATGCSDDLDLILRVFAEWQSAQDPGAWCSTWWINEQALEEALLTVEDTLSSLSSGMKGLTTREVRPELALRARAVITRAMGSLRYQRIDGNRFSLLSDVGAEIVELSATTLVDSGDRIIALNRFRPAKTDGQPRTPLISNVVRVLDWAENEGAGTDDAGFDLIIRGVKHLRDSAGVLRATPDSLRAVRQAFPVGTVIDIETSEYPKSGVISDIASVCFPFAYQGEPVNPEDAGDETQRNALDGRRGRINPSGYDADWNPYQNSDPEIPEEERARQLVDLRAVETNDPPPHKRVPPTSTVTSEGGEAPEVASSALPTLSVIPEHEGTLISTRTRAEIVGYRAIADSQVALVVEPVAEDAEARDPAEHDDLFYWDTVEIDFRGVVRDHLYEHFQFARADGRGHFYLRQQTQGVAANDREFVGRLLPGARFTARVIPGWKAERVTVTLLPTAIEHLEGSPFEQHQLRGEATKFYLASIVEGPNKWGKLLVELDHRDEANGLSHRFEVRQKSIEYWDGLSTEVGQRLLVALEADRSKYRRTLPVQSDDTLALVERHAQFLRLVDGQIRAGGSKLPFQVIHYLLELDDSHSWRRAVWLFLIDNLHLLVRAVRPLTSRKELSWPNHSTQLLIARKAEIGQRYRVSISINGRGGTVQVVGLAPRAVEAATAELGLIADLPYSIASLPSGTAGIVIGKEGTVVKRLESLPGVVSVNVDSDKVTVIGETDSAVLQTIDEIHGLVSTVTGEMVVPAGKNGYVIGKGGSTIRSLSAATGCRAQNEGHRWRIEGPSENAVKSFIRMASEKAWGTTGRVIGSTRLTVLEGLGQMPKGRPSHRNKPVKLFHHPLVLALILILALGLLLLVISLF